MDEMPSGDIPAYCYGSRGSIDETVGGEAASVPVNFGYSGDRLCGASSGSTYQSRRLGAGLALAFTMTSSPKG
jgi:hypothetical protein